MEAYLAANGGGAFVPLPLWNSANPIPPEFNVVKNPGPTRPPLANLNPNTPKPAQFEDPAVCDFDNAEDLGNAINGWHGQVHCAIGGTMCSLPVASAAPIFWCWHAFVDHIYWDWQRCAVTVPPVVGYPLPYARHKLNCAGLKCGAMCWLPQSICPPERVPKPAPYPCLSLPEPEPPHVPHSPAPTGKCRQEDESGHSHGDGGHDHNAPGMPSQSFLRPANDLSHLMNGPMVIAQYPAADKSIKYGGCIDLTLLAD